MRRFGGPLAVYLLTAILVGAVVVALLQAEQDASRSIADDQVSLEAVSVQRPGVDLLVALMAERGRVDVFGSADPSAADARLAVDEARAVFEARWRDASAELRDAMRLDSLLDLIGRIDEIRAAEADVRGESYTLLVDSLASAVKDLNLTGSNGAALRNRRAAAAVVDAVVATGQQRRIGARMIGGLGGSATELSVATANADRAVREFVRLESLVPASDGSRAGPDARRFTVDRSLLAAVTNDAPPPEPDEWFDVTSQIVESLRGEIERLGDTLRVGAEQRIADADRDRTIRRGGVVAVICIAALVVAGLAAAARVRKRAAAEYEALASGFERWFTPMALPEMDGLDIAAAYRPASDHALAGGDWYDLMAVGRRTVVVVGDVVGHGPQAAADMARTRYLLRGVTQGSDPAYDIAQVEQRLGEPAMMATISEVVIDVDAATLIFHRAGHLPPLLRTSDGAVHVLDGGGGPPVGVGLRQDHTNGTCAFSEGDTLVVYTDGLIEEPGVVITDAIAGLAAQLAAAGSRSEDVVAALLDAVSPASQRDDIALVAITRGPSTPRDDEGSVPS